MMPYSHPANFSLRDADRYALQQIAVSMGAWLRFLGATLVFLGALLTFTIIALPLAWAPLWMGVLLFQAGIRAKAATGETDMRALSAMLQKLRSFIVLATAALLLFLAFMVVGFVYFGEMLHGVSSRLAGLL